MPQPVAPGPTYDELVLNTIQVFYDPSWDGANWVVTPSAIVVQGNGQLVNDDSNIASATVRVNYDDLPAGAQNALQQLYTFIEDEIAATL